MASIRKVHHTWVACLSFGNGKRTERSTGIKDRGSPKERADAKRKALTVAQEMEEAVRGNKTEVQIRKTITDLFFKVNGKRVEFSACDHFIRTWLERIKLQKAEKTYLRYRGIMDEFLESLGSRKSVPLAEITAADVQSFFDAGQRDGKKPKTLQNERRILNGPFNNALKQGLIITNPVAAADLPNDPGESKSPFSIEQVRALFMAADGDWRTAVMLGAYTGARLADCVSFTWGNFDLAKRLLRYQPGKTRRYKKIVVCPLHPVLHAYLLGLPSVDDPGAFLTSSLAGRYSGGSVGLSNGFISLMAKAGIENPFTVEGQGKGRGFRAFGFHSFRHTFKSLLVNAGVAVETADVLTGHAKRTVSETYIHRSIGLLTDAVAKLPNFSID